MFTEMCAFMGIYEVSSGNSIPNVAGQPIGPSSGIKQTFPYFRVTRQLQTQMLGPQTKDAKMKMQV